MSLWDKMTKATTRILITEILSEDLMWRSNAKLLFELVDATETEKVILDFSEVKSITRSFANEYFILKKFTEKTVVEENINSFIRKMLDYASQEYSSVQVHYAKHIELEI